MKTHQLLLFLSLLLVHCSDTPEYVAVEPLTTIVNTKKTAGFSDAKNAYFGDFHVHTSWSFDAFINSVRTTPDDAYRYGKGEVIPHISGKPIQIQRPLDFMAVTDHSEYMGILMQMKEENNPLSQSDIAKILNDPDPKISKKAFGKIRFSIATNWPYKELIKQDIIQSVWKKNVEAADRHYEPGKFTAFPAYEWSSSPAVYFSWPQYAKNMHRNRLKDTNDKLPPVGNTVNTSTATYTNDIGAVSFQIKWTDPEFDSSISSFYYLRALEIPTPRWTTYDAVALGVALPTEVPPTIQERAWSSPIWYKP